MAINLSDNIKVNAPKPIDDRYLASDLTPYANVAAANAAIVPSRRHIGLRVRIGSVDYHWKDGVTDLDLVEIESGGGGGDVPSSRTITGVKSITGGGDLSANRTVELAGDEETPNSLAYYGTDVDSIKGYHPLPVPRPSFTSFNVTGYSPEDFVEVGNNTFPTDLEFTWTTAEPTSINTDSIYIEYVNTSTVVGFEIPNAGIYSTSVASPITDAFAADGKTFRIYASYWDGTISRDLVIPATYPYFWGKVTSSTRPVINAAAIAAGNKVVADPNVNFEIPFNSGPGDYIWFAVPSTVAPKTNWREDGNPLNTGVIEGSVVVGGNLFPSPASDVVHSSVAVTTALWAGVNYTVYVSNYRIAVDALQVGAFAATAEPGGESGQDGQNGADGVDSKARVKQLPKLLSKYDTAGKVNPSFLLVGDSVIEQKVTAIKDALIQRYGDIQSDASWNMGGAVSAGATAVTNGTNIWPTGLYHNVPTGGIVTYGLSTVAPVLSDQVSLYYVEEPGAGTFKVQGSYNSGAYVDLPGTIDANSGSTQTAVHTVTLPYGLNMVRIVGVSGTVKVLTNCRYTKTGQVGARVASLHRGGYNVQGFSETPVELLAPVLVDWEPDVVIFEVKDPSEMLATYLDTFLSRISEALAYTPDFIILGPNVDPTSIEADRPLQIAILRQWAEDNNQTFIDQSFLFGRTAAEGASVGLQVSAENVHPTPLGYTAQVTRIFEEVDAVTGGVRHSHTRPRSIFWDHDVVTLDNTFRSVMFNSGKIKQVSLGASSLTATPSRCSATLLDGNVNLRAEGTALANDFSRATLSGKVNSGTGTGAGTRFNIPMGFSVRFARIVRAGAVLRFFIGNNTSGNLAAAGFGIQINPNDTAQILAHNGTTLTVSPTFPIGTFTLEIQMIVSSDAQGNVAVYYSLAGLTMPRTPTLITTGGPISTAPSGSDRFVAALSVESNQSLVNDVHIIDALIYQGAALIP